MNKEAISICVFICLVSLTASVSSVKSQTAGAIFINSDGSVSGTTSIQRDGNLYRLTANLYDSPVVVLRNNSVIDGEGFVLQGAGGWGTPGVAGLENTAAIDLTCSNVTVQDFVISGWETGVAGTYDGNTVADNNISSTENAVAIYSDNNIVSGNSLANSIYAVYIKGNNNFVSRNQIDSNYGGIMIFPTLKTTVTENNFTNNGICLTIGTYDNFSYQIYDNNLIINPNTTVVSTTSDALGFGGGGTLPPLDNGSVGNYWSDYATKYPSATEIDHTGIEDIQYVIRSDPTVIDRYPLTTPFTIRNITIASPTQTPTPSLVPTPTPQSKSFPVTWILFGVVVVAIVLGADLAVYFKNRNH